jgi:hypothetical protein
MEEPKNRSLVGPSTKKHDQVEIERSLDELARYLDGLFRIPGTGWRFGLDAIVGLVPSIGDTLTSLVSFYILIAGVRYGVPKITLARMALNVGVDYLVGTIPIVGDVFDFYWKSNQKNVELIRARAIGKKRGAASDYVLVFGLIGLLVLILVGSIVVSGLVLYYLFGRAEVALG